MSYAGVPASLVPNWLGNDELLPGDTYNIARELREYDPNLCLGIDGLTGKYEVYYVSPKLGNNPQLIHTVENPDGSWRPLDHRVIKHLYENDLRRGENSWRSFMKAREASEENRLRYMADIYSHLKADIDTAKQVSGSHRDKFYMHRPKTRARVKHSLEDTKNVMSVEEARELQRERLGSDDFRPSLIMPRGR